MELSELMSSEFQELSEFETIAIIRKEVLEQGAVVIKTYRDNGAQTDERPENDNIENASSSELEVDDEPFPRSRAPVEMRDCSICFNPFSDKRQIMLLSCDHVFCRICVDRLYNEADNDYFEKINCPLCRKQTWKTACRIPVFTSARCLVEPERLRYKKALSWLRLSEITKAITIIEELLVEEKRFQEHVKLPLFCSKRKLDRNRSEMLGGIVNSGNIKRAEDLGKILKNIDKYIAKILYKIAHPPQHLTYDSSKEVANVIVKFMKEGESSLVELAKKV